MGEEGTFRKELDEKNVKHNLDMIIPVQPVAWAIRQNDEGVNYQVAPESTEHRAQNTEYSP